MRLIIVAVVTYVTLLATGCASLPQHVAAEMDAAHLSPVVELDTVPFFPQQRHQCGPAALATLISYAGREADLEKITERVFVPARQGSFQLELVAAARSVGLVPYPLSPLLTDVFREISHGHPVLVLQNLGASWLPQWHYAVVVGYDLPKGVVRLRSGKVQRLELPISTFFATWNRAESWAMVVVAPQEVPATAQPERFFRVVNELDQTGEIAAARQAYEAATLRWPNEPNAWFLAGNVAYGQGDAESAEHAFRRAIQLAPHIPVFWNNLAYAAAARGCGRLASLAAQCAFRLAPTNPSIKDTIASPPSIVSSVNVCEDIVVCPQ